MYQATLIAFSDEMEKIAFGMRQGTKVLRIVKGMQLPKASQRAVPMGLAAIPPAGPSAISRVASLQRAGVPSHALPTTQELRTSMKGVPGGGIGSQISTGKVLPGSDQMRAMEKGVPDRNKKMLHAVLKGHELDELKTVPSLGAEHMGHMSPAVIYRESNRVATLPKAHKPVADFMQNMRGRGFEGTLFPSRLPYGKQRLSRHAIKRLTALQGEKTVGQAKSLGMFDQP